jgi:UDP-N-acetylmuramoyl-L-alanyl-D-glutamate--2,6-diaminopimelate ligase
MSHVTGTAPLALRPEHPVARSLSGLVSEFGIDEHDDLEDLEVTGVSLSSRSVLPGDLYVGVPGVRVHGASFAAEAAASGAVAILTDAEGAVLARESGLPLIVTPDARAALGHVSSWIYRTDENPPTLFGVTGTNGKTSVVYLIYAVLQQLGVLSGLSSTAERRIGPTAVTSALTTPEATELHALIARMREDNVRAIAIEVSAQALTRHRVDGVVFDVAGFTNVSHDHLDDYAAMEDYFKAKLALFQPERARRGVAVVDTEWGGRLVAESRIPLTTISSLPDVDAEWRVTVTRESIDDTSFTLEGPDGRRLATTVPLLGEFMASNAALAIVMLVEAGYDLGVIAQALERDGGIDAYVPGRAERISGDRGPVVFVDYGHTPDAFQRTLDALRKVTSGRIVMVFGADGDRDTSKRADMGAIAARGADVVVITDFHPRFEDPAAIRTALVEGARAAVPGVELYEIADQRAAFRAALAMAAEGDVVLYAGPGHEDYQDVAGEHLPYSARDDVRAALREAGWLE